jgi:hypothetical protein
MRQSIENYKVMRWLDQERERQNLSLRDVAQALGPGYRSATRVGEYFQQRIVAGPDMLARLAAAVNVSPIDALWNARHHGEVLDYLVKLYRLGWSWAHHDRVMIHQDSGADFMLQYEEIGFPEGGDLREPPPSLAHRYHLATVNNYEGNIFRRVSLPKPMAVAILLSVALFPRRGEKLRPEATPFYEQLSFIAWKMMPAAEIARVPPAVFSAFKKPVKDAAAVWKYRFYGPMRLAIIGEYMHAWCDFVCRDYANYARLALYEQGAFVGEPGETEDIWAWQSTSMPSADEFKVENAEQ